jgi:hypothetical protein
MIRMLQHLWRRLQVFLPVLILTFPAPPVHAAPIALDNKSSRASTGPSQTNTFAHTTGSGADRLMLIACSMEDNTTASDMNITSVTYAGVAAAAVPGGAVTVNTFDRVQLWYLPMPASGTNNVVATFAGVVGSSICGALTLVNAKQAAPEAVATKTSTATGAISTSVTTITGSAWLVDAVLSAKGGQTFTPTGGQTEQVDLNNTVAPDNHSFAMGTKAAGASPGSQTTSWTSTGFTSLTGVAHVLMSIAPAPSATGDTTPPTVSLSAPAAGAAVRQTITVSATASDNVGVVGVQFKLDGANLGAEDTTNPYSVSWNTTTATAGNHTLTAFARDAAGNSATSAARTVTVDNTGPAISITSPANNSVITP